MTRPPTRRWPAEWEEHAATWIAWPHNRDDWPGKFGPIPWVYVEVVRLLSRHEPVELLDYALPGRLAGRGVLVATFGKGRAQWKLAVTHLSLGQKSRQMQVDFLADLFGDCKRLVLMGDFNCDADAPEMRALYRHTCLAPPPKQVFTFPSWSPARCLDHVLAGGFEIGEYTAIQAAGSDHMAVSVELTPV